MSPWLSSALAQPRDGPPMNVRILVLAIVLTMSAHGQPPELQLARRYASGEVSLIVSPRSTNWVTLESSSDLIAWHSTVELLTTNATIPYEFTPATNAAMRFYRVRHPGTPAAEALARWSSLKPESYRYTFSETRPSRTLWGTVIVSDGVKTVSNSFVYEFSTMTTNLNADLVLSVEDMFDLLSDMETHGIQQAETTYDRTWGFPYHVYRVYWPAFISRFTIRDFEELSD
jgi:hypothetical protein